ncbi:hypothetical protein [Capnocytophaga sputigena]|uniref:hypothetical protein n=1 Tax=Capnocytophaga sputigena TaxID=1019 RepID=UPI000F6E95F2|nr:hypothetical protein [Capnocytophaga sputigena]VEI52674.1 Uncharacterised protein [Capnocytophaga sputigena]
MRCIENIKDIALDCLYKPSRGLRNRILLIHYNDIDRRYTTFNSQKSEITNLQLKVDKKGVLIETKNSFKVKGSQKFSGGFIHEVSLKIDKVDSVNLAVINSLTRGSYVVIVETSGNTFEVLGYDAGMTLSNIQRDYAGNVIPITFTTPNDVKELRMSAIWNETDYNTTNKRFEKKAFSVGRNLLRDSGVVVTNNKYEIASYQVTEDIKLGDTITLTIDGDFADGCWPLLMSGGGNGNYGSLQRGVNVWKNNLNLDFKKGDAFLVFIIGNGDGTKTNTIRKIKLERGDKATRWVPSSEDN